VIPLSTSDGVSRFPWPTVVLMGAFLVAELIARAWPGAKIDFLLRVAHSADWQFARSFAFLFHPHLFLLSVNLLFLWVFTPPLFERKNLWFCLITAYTGVQVAYSMYRLVHPGNMSLLLAPEAFVAALIGLSMRDSIWETIYTLVAGFFWIRFYDVPSYVHLFFFLFYLLISQFLMPAELADAPMPYLIPLVSFLWGFALSYGLKSQNK
jgi:hypothetical protein